MVPETTPALVRTPDWPERLAAWLAARGNMAFAWGVNDCALFAADGVLELTGVDLAAGLRGSYASREQAAAVLARHGGLQAIVAARLPAYPSPLRCHRGDVVCVQAPVDAPELDLSTQSSTAGEHRWTLGLVAGNGYWAVPGLRRIVYRPMAEVQHAYAVG